MYKCTLLIIPNDIITLQVRTCIWHNSIIHYIRIFLNKCLFSQNFIFFHIGTQFKQCMCTKKFRSNEANKYISIFRDFTNFDFGCWELWRRKMKTLFSWRQSFLCGKMLYSLFIWYRFKGWSIIKGAKFHKRNQYLQLWVCVHYECELFRYQWHAK